MRGQQHWEYGSAEKLVHIKCKQSIRKTLDLPSVTFAEIDAFPASPLPVGPDHVLSPHEPTDDSDAQFSRDQQMIVAAYIDQDIPSVANHLKALVHKSKARGYRGLLALLVHSSALTIVDMTTHYFLTEDAWKLHDEIVGLVAEN